MLAVLALLWLLAHKDAVIVITSSSKRQLKIVWREIHRLYRRADLKKKLGGTLNSLELRISEARLAVGVAADIPENLGGFHAERVLCIADESSALEPDQLESLLGNAVGEHDRVLLSGNPLRPSGPFFDCFRASDWHTVAISALDCPGVSDDRKSIPGLATRQWIERRKAAWGEGSPAYVARVLGQFPEMGTDSLFSLTDIEACFEREAKPVGKRIAGIDLARFGDDLSVAIVRQGDAILHVESWGKLDLMESCGRIVELKRQWEIETLCIDETGLGSGLVDRLKELKVEGVIGVNAASRAHDEARFLNRRAELFWALRDRIKALCIPFRYADRFQELASIRYKFASSGKIQIEAKSEIKARLGRSPDFADALSLACAGETASDRQLLHVISFEDAGKDAEGRDWRSFLHERFWPERDDYFG